MKKKSNNTMESMVERHWRRQLFVNVRSYAANLRKVNWAGIDILWKHYAKTLYMYYLNL